MSITIETTVNAPLDTVWHAWTNADDIVQWNAASEDWHTTAAQVELQEGGTFSSRMEAKDGSMGFDFAGTYTQVITQELLEYRLGDGRMVQVRFSQTPQGVLVRETFDPEQTHPAELQRQGWQAILDNFKRYAEGKMG